MAVNRRRKRARRRYAWALRFPPADERVRRLSAEAQHGLDYARELAHNRRERRELSLAGAAPPLLTVSELAAEEELAAVTIHERIKRARVELFGSDVSESTIYYRLTRATKLPWRSPGECQERGCARALPAGASRRRRYCAEHATSAARVRRHRRAPQGERQLAAEQPPALARTGSVTEADEHERRLPAALEHALARRFAETVMREAPLPNSRWHEVERAPAFALAEGELECSCALTGSRYARPWDGSALAAEAFASHAGGLTARLIRETPRHRWLLVSS